MISWLDPLFRGSPFSNECGKIPRVRYVAQIGICIRLPGFVSNRDLYSLDRGALYTLCCTAPDNATMYIYIYMYVCMYVHIYICMYIHIYNIISYHIIIWYIILCIILQFAIPYEIMQICHMITTYYHYYYIGISY